MRYPIFTFIYHFIICLLLVLNAHNIVGAFGFKAFVYTMVPFWLNFIFVNHIASPIIINMPQTKNKSFLDLPDGGIEMSLSIASFEKYKGKPMPEVLLLETKRLIEALDADILEGSLDDNYDYGVYIDTAERDKLIYKVTPKTPEARIIVEGLKDML